MNKLVKKILVGVTLVGIAASVFLGTTFSKYTNKITGNGETEVAKWNFKVNTATKEFANIKLAETYDESTLLNGKIAPGSKGSFDLVIDATGTEVGVKYVVDFENETNKPSNLIFKYKASDNTIKTFSNIEEYEQYFTDTIDADDTNKIKTLTVEWEWPYQTETNNEIANNDKIDTSEGLQALDYTFDIIVTGTQVVPTK